MIGIPTCFCPAPTPPRVHTQTVGPQHCTYSHAHAPMLNHVLRAGVSHLMCMARGLQ